MKQIEVSNFRQWQLAARELLQADIAPESVQWNPPDQYGLFVESTESTEPGKADKSSGSTQRSTQVQRSFKVPPAFMALAKGVACYRDNKRWSLLYRTLWRLTHGERHLLKITTDADIHQLNSMAKQVSRDAHKMKAFVRFREVAGEANSYVAWHEPVHLIVEYTAPFFVRRFTAMNWAILTPDCCARWDGESLVFSEGVTRDQAPSGDDMEALWKTFYRNIFNPARIKLKMMKSEMPVKYWHTMPETALIPGMLEEADKRVEAMLEASSGTTERE